jgi:hypothetical protein
MNLKNLYDKSWLEKTVENRDELLKEIRQTKGFILNRLKDENLMPKIEWLWQDISSYSVIFIIDNYYLPEEAKKELNEYLNERNQFTITEEKLVATNMQQALEKGISYPHESKLSLSLLKQYPKAVENLMTNDKNIKSQVRSILNQLTLEELLTIDDKFFTRNFALLKEVSHLMHLDEAKEFYKKVARQVQENLNNKDDARVKKEYALNLFENYIFNDNEKDFLFELIKNEEAYRRSFSLIEKIPSARSLISKEEFFTHFKNDDLSFFSLHETDQYQELISQIWLNDYLSNEVIALDDFLLKKTTLEQFKTIITQEFIEKLYNADKSFHINFNEEESPERKIKDLFVKKALFNIIIKNPDSFKSNVNIIDFMNIFEQCNKSKQLNDNEKIQAKQIMNKKFHEALQAENFFSLYNESNVYRPSLYDCFINEAENHPSANLLIMMIKTYLQSGYNGEFTFAQKRKVGEIINQVVSKINDEEVVEISSWMKFPIDTDLLNKNAPKSPGFSENMLSIEEYHPAQTGEHMNVFLITEFEKFSQKFIQEKGVLNNYSLKRILNHKEVDRLTFMHDYIAIHPEILNDKELRQIFKKNKNMVHYVQESAEEKEKNWSEFLSLVKQCIALQEIEQQKDSLKPTKKSDFNTDTQEIKDLKEAMKVYIDNIDVETFEQKFRNLLNEKEFNIVRFIQYSCHFEKKDILIKEYLKTLDYEQWTQNLEQNAFVKIAKTILTQGSRMNTIDIDDAQQAFNLASLLSIKMQEPSYNILTSFTQKSRASFIHEFLIEHATKEMFYDFQFQVNTDPHSKKESLINKPFTNEQILRAYHKMEKNGSVFQDKNFRENEIKLFDYNFVNNELAYHEMIKIAQDYPKLYVLLSKNDIYRDMVDKEFENSEEAQNAYLVKHFNLDILLEGFKEMIEELHTQDRTQINTEVLKKASTIFLSGTYYHIYEKGNDPEYASYYNEEQSRQIITLLLEKNPLFLQYYSHIGCLDCSEDVARHYNYYDSIHVMETFLLTQEYMAAPSFGYTGRFKDYTEKICNAIVNDYMNEEKIEEIHYLLHLVKQSQDNKKLSPYLLRTEPLSGMNMDFFIEMNYPQKLEKFLKKHALEKKLDNLYQDNDDSEQEEIGTKLKI